MLRIAISVVALLWAAGTLAAHPGIGIVMDSGGNVFYTDLKQVWKITPDGRKAVVVPGVHTHELYLDAQDNLYGEHLWYEGERTNRWGHYVWRLSADGRLEKIIPPRQGFLSDYGYSFVRDAQGSMYWAAPGSPVRIQKRAPDGTISTLATGSFRNVRWMAASPDGTVYLEDLWDLVRIPPGGQITVLARNLARNSRSFLFFSNEHALMGLAPDRDANVYIAVTADRVVKKVTPAGAVSVAARSPIPWSPTGVLPARNGDLWILEGAGPISVRARRVRPDGSSTSF